MKQLMITVFLFFSIQIIHAQSNLGIQVADLDVSITGKLILDSKEDNIFIGLEAGTNTMKIDEFDGQDNTFMGSYAGYLNTTGSSNTFIGRSSGYGITTGGANTFVGTSSGNSFVTSGNSYWNIAIGYQSGNESGNNNIFIGNNSGSGCDYCYGSIFIGHRQVDFPNVGSSELFIEGKSSSTTALIHGDFEKRIVEIDGELSIGTFLHLTPKASSPVAPEKGIMYYDSSDDKVKVWTGSNWENLLFTSSTEETSLQQPNNSPCNTLCQEDNQKLKIRVELLEQKLQKYEDMENKLKRMEQLISQLSESPNVIQKIEISKLARLEQNTPNPFHGNTKIKYFLPEDSENANIKIYDAGGRIVKNVKIKNRGQGEIEMPISEFYKGIYHYSLEIDGQIIDTKKMSSIK